MTKNHPFSSLFFFMVNPSQCQAVHEVQSATYAKQYMQTTYAFSFFFFRMNPPQCQAVHEVQGAAYTALVGSTGSQEQTTAPPQTRALYTIRHRVGQQGTKDKGTTGDKRQRDKAQQAHRHRKDNRGPKTEGQQGTKDRETNSFFFSEPFTVCP